MKQIITSVNSVCFSIEKSNPPQLVVHAIGKVSSTGWSSARLVPRVYVSQPADGIQDFDFVAGAPKGKVLWIVCPIDAEETVILEAWIKGVRVNAATNNMTANLNDISCTVSSGVLLDQVVLRSDGTVDYFKDPADPSGGPSPIPPDAPKILIGTSPR